MKGNYSTIGVLHLKIYSIFYSKMNVIARDSRSSFVIFCLHADIKFKFEAFLDMHHNVSNQQTHFGKCMVRIYAQVTIPTNDQAIQSQKIYQY